MNMYQHQRAILNNMLACKQIVVAVISWTFLVTYVYSQTTSCDAGWFGSQCQYKCRCNNNHCDENGLCTSDASCQPGWFGPSCQFADLAYNRATSKQITDGDDNTCTTSWSHSATITLDNSYQFTWIRVHLNTPDYMDKLAVTLNSDLPCTNPRKATVDERTLDINCDVHELVQNVTLKGDAVPQLCSVYVSGGRNVALRQVTSQSSTYLDQGLENKDPYTTYPASNSVDGNNSGDFYGQKSCSHTIPKWTPVPNWNVSFTQPRSVNRYALYNRNDSKYEVNNKRLQGFTLEGFDETGRRVFTFRDTLPDVPAVYTVIPRNVTSLISLVNITVVNDEQILQICEVEIYGESACEPGKYGRDCELTCHCAGGESCFTSTGGCPSGCPVGYYGESCDLECRPENYGPGCKSTCSPFCAKTTSQERSCDRFNGSCLYGCEGGYLGPSCSTPCKSGYYGKGCGNSCSEHCAKITSGKTSCEQVNGTCLYGCEIGYTGPVCSTLCDRGKYGLECNLNCSMLCVDTNKTEDSVCSHITGVCTFGCTGKQSSSFCHKESKSSGSEIPGAVVGSILGAIFIILVVLVVICVIRRHKDISIQTKHRVVRATVKSTGLVDNKKEVAAYEEPKSGGYENDQLENVYEMPKDACYTNQEISGNNLIGETPIDEATGHVSENTDYMIIG